MMAVRKKASEILIIILGAAYLVYRFIAPRADIHPAGGIAGKMSGEMARLKEISKKAAQADNRPKGAVEHMRDIFQEPGELAGVEASAGAAPSGPQNNALSLEGTIWGQNKNIAIISGMVVVEGDQIGGGKVVRIEPDRVVILKNGLEIEIKRGAPNEQKE